MGKMGNRRKRRVIWLNVWHIREQEAWFADMAAQGWQLVDVGNIFVTFEQANPQNTNYRCDIFDPDDPNERNRIQFYRESGWEHVATRQYIQIFKEMADGKSKEVPADPARQKYTAEILNKRIKKKAGTAILATLVAVILQFLTLQNNPIGNYLEDGFIFFLIIAIIYIYSIVREVTSMVQMSKLVKKLTPGKLHGDGVNYQWKMHQKRLISIVMTMFVALLIIYASTSMFSYDIGEEIPQGDLHVVQRSDVIDESEYEQVNITGEDYSLYNYYAESSSLFVPEQYELHDNVDVVSKNNGKTYSLSIWSDYYVVRNEWIAKQFIKTLKKEYTDDARDFKNVEDDRFDELWIHRDKKNVEILIRKANEIHRFSFYSTKQMDGVTEKVLVKIDDL